MSIYIAERGCYEDRYVAGVYDSPERAMADQPGTVWTKTTWTYYPGWPDRTRVDHHVSWDNDLDWEDAVTITEAEIIADGPLRQADEKRVQTYRESDGGWDFLPEEPEKSPEKGA